MRTKLYGYISIVLEKLNKLVECRTRIISEFCTVEFIKNIPYEHGRIDRRQREIDRVARGMLNGIDSQLLLVIQKAVACGKEHIFHTGFDNLLETAVAFQPELHVCSVISYHVNRGLGKFVAILLINPTGNGMHHFGTLKRINMIPTAPVLTIAAEKATVVHTLESHSEIITGGIDRRRKYFHLPSIVHRVGMGAINVKSSHAGMTV